MGSYSSGISKESSRWLRDVSSQYHNNILQTQRPSGILAVMAITKGIDYFLRRMLLLHRRGCLGMTAAGGSSGTTSHASSIFSLFFSLDLGLLLWPCRKLFLQSSSSFRLRMNYQGEEKR